MYLVRLVHACHATRELSEADHLAYLEQRRRLCQENHLTGLLITQSGKYLELLEGPRMAVNQAYNGVVRASGFCNVTLLHFGDAHERLYTDWSAGYLDDDALTVPVLLRFGVNDSFQPERMSGEAALGLLREAALLIEV
ncbi:BLUF domain-containing protein [Chitinolyticbacter meiyuanensis]|uniref:BLUF domain-containing protein n=1 Tax=Chitinolyticbacter meiyuanensis TaxID=682798 RepID=UPI0011E5A896|nr:BLUF domain-containing protein [Chitinolyticbacter meiyuanensis]